MVGMKKLLALFVLASVALILMAGPVGAAPAPHALPKVEVAQIKSFLGVGPTVPTPFMLNAMLASFPGQAPDSQFVVMFTAYHEDWDMFPYFLGVGAYSTSYGVVRAIAPLDDLSANYEGLGFGPVKYVKACLINTDLCTVVTYTGYLPESLFPSY